MRSRAVLACAFAVLWPATAWAANTAPSSLTPSILPLALVGLVALLATKWLKSRQPLADPRMRVVTRLPIEPRRSIIVVQVGGRAFLVGSSEAGLQALGEVDPQTFASADADNVSRETSGDL